MTSDTAGRSTPAAPRRRVDLARTVSVTEAGFSCHGETLARLEVRAGSDVGTAVCARVGARGLAPNGRMIVQH